MQWASANVSTIRNPNSRQKRDLYEVIKIYEKQLENMVIDKKDNTRKLHKYCKHLRNGNIRRQQMEKDCSLQYSQEIRIPRRLILTVCHKKSQKLATRKNTCGGTCAFCFIMSSTVMCLCMLQGTTDV